MHPHVGVYMNDHGPLAIQKYNLSFFPTPYHQSKGATVGKAMRSIRAHVRAPWLSLGLEVNSEVGEGTL